MHATCSHCGYDLTGLAFPRPCPECGGWIPNPPPTARFGLSPAGVIVWTAFKVALAASATLVIAGEMLWHRCRPNGLPTETDELGAWCYAAGIIIMLLTLVAAVLWLLAPRPRGPSAGLLIGPVMLLLLISVATLPHVGCA